MTKNKISPEQRLLDQEKVTKDMLGALIFHILEDDLTKRRKRYNSLLIKAEAVDTNGIEHKLEGIVGNEDFIITSLRYYDVQTKIKKGEIQLTEEQDNAGTLEPEKEPDN